MTKTIPEVILLKYFLSYTIYNKYNRYIYIDKAFKELKILYHSLGLLHSKFPDTDKTVEDLAAMVFASYPNMKEVEREAITDLLEKVSEVVASPDVLNSILETIRKRSVARDMALKSLEVAEGNAAWEELASLYDSLQERDSGVEPLERLNFVTDDLNVLESHTIKSPGLRWRLNCLNRSLGPLRPGDFGFVFARPETGKTTFLASEISFMAGQTQQPVIWFNNEEQGEKVRLRIIQATLGYTADELWIDKAKTQSLYNDATKGLIRIVDEAAIYRGDVELVVKELQPSLVIFDQIDKLYGFAEDRDDLHLGAIYIWARELAKRQKCAVIGVCQSDGTGEGVKWLTMSHVANAKTSKQAEADWILGIGRSNEVSTDDIRFFNISKNKLLGDDQTDPNDRHGRFEVYIRPMIARYEDLE